MLAERFCEPHLAVTEPASDIRAEREWLEYSGCKIIDLNRGAFVNSRKSGRKWPLVSGRICGEYQSSFASRDQRVSTAVACHLRNLNAVDEDIVRSVVILQTVKIDR